jgi:hypothetical protein
MRIIKPVGRVLRSEKQAHHKRLLLASPAVIRVEL